MRSGLIDIICVVPLGLIFLSLLLLVFATFQMFQIPKCLVMIQIFLTPTQPLNKSLI